MATPIHLETESSVRSNLEKLVFASGEDSRAIFAPDPNVAAQSQLAAFMRYCEDATGRAFSTYNEFHAFSVSDFRAFWRLFLAWTAIPHHGETEPVCVGETCEHAQFFPNLKVNYAEVLLGNSSLDESVAITSRSVDGSRTQITRGELRNQVARLAAFLADEGVSPGDRIAAIARNGPEAIIAALAAASIGAVFSSCAPDMGADAILSRFTQIKPSVLLSQLRTLPFEARQGVSDLTSSFAQVVQGLPTLRTLIGLDDGPAPSGLALPVHRLEHILADETATLDRAMPRFPANHPVFILFSSGTTGAPKCIIHGAVGTLLEHLKEHRLHGDLREGETLFFQTSCAWMMWNWQLGALACGAQIVVYDGPLEGPETLWRIVAQERVNVFGTSPAYLQMCEQAGYEPRRLGSMSHLRAVLSTGSILYAGQYDWVKERVGRIPLQSISGGTDIVGCFVLGNPMLPVYRGDSQCRSLAMDVRAWPCGNDNETMVGELICANPFPSRPLGFFGDESGARFHAAYFSQNPGVWTHGDLIEFTPEGGARLHGRSDGVMNIRGIRVGPGEIYAILRHVDEIEEALAVEQNSANDVGGGRLILLIVLRPDVQLDDALKVKIRSTLVKRGSPALLPSRIVDVPALPKTHSGKASEAAARDAVNGRDVRNRAGLKNPEVLEAIAAHPALVEDSADTSVIDKSDETIPHSVLEALLCEMAKEILDLSSINPSDNLHDLGLDSLSIFNLSIKIQRQLGYNIGVATVVSLPTITQLATHIHDHWHELAAQTRNTKPQGPHIRDMTFDDIEAVRRLLNAGFHVSADRLVPWQRLVDYGWLKNKPKIGVVLVDNDEVVGFLGLVYSKREIEGKEEVFCNLSTWFIKSDYRGWGAALLSAGLEDEAVTYTAFTPAPLTKNVLKTLGFEDRSETKRLFPPLFNARSLFQSALPIHFEHHEIEEILSPEHTRIFRDHQGCNGLHAVIGGRDEYCYLVTVRRQWSQGFGRVRIELPFSEILYCSNWSFIAKDVERIKFAIMRRQRSVAVMADKHFTNAAPVASLSIAGKKLFESPIFVRSKTVSASEIDKLYSELVLLPL